MRRYISLLLFIGLTFWGCGENCYDYEEIVPYEVEYLVKGSNASITYQNTDGGTSQHSNVNLPWSYKFNSIGDTWVYCSAQNQNSWGTVRVEVKVNGNIKFESSSSGAYVIASAHGTISGDSYTNTVTECD